MEHQLMELFTLLFMAFALGMDAFSIGLGMGAFKLRLRQVAIIGTTVGLFHVWMPLLGILSGRLLSAQFGTFASYVGAALLMFLGIQMVITGIRGDEESIIAPVGTGLIIFATSVSLDGFSVGLSLGILGSKTLITILCFGFAAFVLTTMGLLLGRKVHTLLGKYSQIFGGAIMLVFGLKIILQLSN